MKKKIAIIGGGASALALSSFIDTNQYDVTIYEKNKSLGRKFLVAGDGGFNLTHAESIEKLSERYHPVDWMKPILNQFTNEDFRAWLDDIGIPTFTGSSERVFPERGIKPIEVLNKILDVIRQKGIDIKYQMVWNGWNKNGQLIFNNEIIVKADITVFALGGASWKVTGSDGTWKEHFVKEGIDVIDFASANCAFEVQWPDQFLSKYQGTALKNIEISFEGKTQSGEVVITEFGLEGNAIYPLSRALQSKLLNQEEAIIRIDLKPMFSNEKVYQRIIESKESTIVKTLKRQLNLPKPAIDLLKTFLSKEDFIKPIRLANQIKNLPLQVLTAAPIDEAISTLGGVSQSSLTSLFEFKTKPGHYCLGEMINWYAPTGGYLLQGCFSQGVALARQLNDRVSD